MNRYIYPGLPEHGYRKKEIAHPADPINAVQYIIDIIWGSIIFFDVYYLRPI